MMLLRYNDLSGKNLPNADYSNSTIVQCKFIATDLAGANFTSTEIMDTSMQDANLCEANLCDAKLKDVDLRGADMACAILRGTILDNVNLQYAEGIYFLGPLKPSGDIMYAIRHPIEPYFKFRDFWGTYDEAIKEFKGDEMRRALLALRHLSSPL